MKFPHTATVQSLTKVGTKYTYSDSTSIQCFLQPLDTEYARSTGMNLTKAFQCFIPYTASVDEGQRLTIDGTTYGVAGVREHNYGTLKHKRLLLEKE